MERLDGVKVLVADDAPDNQTLVGKYLALSGATSEFANDGEECVRKTLKDSCDVVLMDIRMPNMDGYEATRTLRDRGFTKPIIALTACTTKSEVDKCIEVGFSTVLTKPIDRNKLVSTIKKLTLSHTNDQSHY